MAIKLLMLLILSLSLCRQPGEVHNSPLQKLTIQTDTLKCDGRDPVCGMKVSRGSTITSRYKNKVYGFCTKSCKKSFEKHPEHYLSKK